MKSLQEFSFTQIVNLKSHPPLQYLKLWIQSEIDIQNKVKQAYFQMFNSKTNYILDARHSINKNQSETKRFKEQKSVFP